MKISSFLTAILLIYIVAAALFAQPGKPKANYEWDSYLAHVAAASASLRLHEAADAKRWLSGAPSKYRGWEWGYLNGEAEQSAATFTGNSAAVTAIAVSLDGKMLATASTDKKVRLLKAFTGAELFAFIDEKVTPQSVAFSPDGRRVAAAYSRHSIRVWNVADGKEVLKLQGKGRGITAVTFSPDGKHIASCSWILREGKDVIGMVEIADAESGKTVNEFEYGVKPIVAIAYSPDGKRLAVGSWEVKETVAMWEVGKWEAPTILRSEADDEYKAVQSIAFSPDGSMLAAGGKDSAARIWRVADGNLIRNFGRGRSHHSKWVNGVAFGSDSKSLITASTDQTLRVWDIAKGTSVAVLHGHTKSVNAVAVAPDGRTAYSAGGDQAVKVWNLSAVDSPRVV